MTEELKFGPEWLRALSDGNNPVSPPAMNSSTASTVVTSNVTKKYKLAEHRYSREEMLTLYSRDTDPPDHLKPLYHVYIEHPQEPVTMMPLTDEEQRLMAQGVNSIAALRNTGRGSGPPGRGSGPPERGRGRGSGPGRGLSDGYGPPREDMDGYGRGRGRPDSWDDSRRFERPRPAYDESGPPIRTKDFMRSTSSDNWRDKEYEGRQLEDEGGDWRHAPPRKDWNNRGSSNWRDHPRNDYDRNRMNGPMSRAPYDRPSYRRSKSESFDEDQLPEWSVADDSEELGTFDSSGQFVSHRESDGSRTFRNRARNSESDRGDSAYGSSSPPSSMQSSDSSNKSPPSNKPPKPPQHETGNMVPDCTRPVIVDRKMSPVTEQEVTTQQTLNNDVKNNRVNDKSSKYKNGENVPNTSKDERLRYTNKDVVGRNNNHNSQDMGNNGISANRNNDNVEQSSKTQQQQYVTNNRTVTAQNALNNVGNVSDKNMQNTQYITNSAMNNSDNGKNSQPPVVRSNTDHTISNTVSNTVATTGGVTAGGRKGANKEDDALILLQKEAESMVATVVEENDDVQPKPSTTTTAPFVQPIVSDPVTTSWHYLDPQDLMQGPFTSSEMAEWFNAGYFTMNLQIKRNCDTHFQTLGDLIKSCGGRIPFLDPSNSPTPTAASTEVKAPTVDQMQMMKQQMFMQQHFMLRQMQFMAQMQQQQPDLKKLSQEQQQHMMMELLKAQRVMGQPRSQAPNGAASAGINLPTSAPQDPTHPIQRSMSQPIASSQPSDLNSKSFMHGQWSQPASVWDLDQSVNHNNPSVDRTRQPLSGETQALSEAEMRLFQQFQQHNKIQEEQKRQEMDRMKEMERLKELDEHRKREIEQQRQEEAKRLDELQKLEQLRRQEEVRMQEDLRRLEELKRQEEVRIQELRKQEEIRRQEEIKIQEEIRKQEDMRRQEEIRRLEEHRRQEEIRRQEVRRQEEIRQEEIRQVEIQRQQEMQRQEEIKQEEIRRLEEDRLKAEKKKDQERLEVEALKHLQQQQQQQQHQQQQSVQIANLPSTTPWVNNNHGDQRPELSMTQIQQLEQEQDRAEMIEMQRQAAAEKLRQQKQIQTMQELSNSTKTWSETLGSPVHNKPKSLLEIQLEQEKQLKQEKKTQKLQNNSSEKNFVSAVAGPIWGGNAIISSTWASEGTWGKGGNNAAIVASPWNTSSPPAATKRSKHVDAASFPSLNPTPKAHPVLQKSTSKTKVQQESTRPSSVKQQVAAVQKIFQNTSRSPPEDDFTQWCHTKLRGHSTSVDIPTFISFLQDIDSPYEVHDYCRSYLGETKFSQDFGKLFLEKRKQFRAKMRQQQAEEEESIWGMVTDAKPSKSLMSLTSNDDQKKRGKKTKKMQKVDNSILGFTVHAAQGRVNIGEIDTAEL